MRPPYTKHCLLALFALFFSESPLLGADKLDGVFSGLCALEIADLEVTFKTTLTREEFDYLTSKSEEEKAEYFSRKARNQYLRNSVKKALAETRDVIPAVLAFELQAELFESRTGSTSAANKFVRDVMDTTLMYSIRNGESSIKEEYLLSSALLTANPTLSGIATDRMASILVYRLGMTLERSRITKLLIGLPLDKPISASDSDHIAQAILHGSDTAGAEWQSLLPTLMLGSERSRILILHFNFVQSKASGYDAKISKLLEDPKIPTLAKQEIATQVDFQKKLRMAHSPYLKGYVDFLSTYFAVSHE